MLAVAASEADLVPYLEGDVAIAAVNSARQTMLAGSDEPLARVRARLEADEYIVVTVPASTPFHSPAMQPAVDEALASWSASPRAPQMPLYSGYTGKLMTPEDALSARFWTRQLTDAVYFGPALNELVAMYDVLLVEAGPGQTLTSFARRTKAVRSGASQVLPLLDAADTVDTARARLV